MEHMNDAHAAGRGATMICVLLCTFRRAGEQVLKSRGHTDTSCAIGAFLANSAFRAVTSLRSASSCADALASTVAFCVSSCMRVS